MAERVAVAYLRKSRVFEGAGGEVSHQMQEGAIRRLAEQHGVADLLWLEDWGVSGSREKEDKRPGYKRLLDMIAADEVAIVFGYSMSRFTRSLQSFREFAQLASDHGTLARFDREGLLDYTSPMGRMMVGQLGLLAEFELELARQRAQDAINARRQRGDVFGNAPYGAARLDNALVPVPKELEIIGFIVEKYAETRSLAATASWLNGHGVPTKQGKGVWRSEVVKGVISRHAPGLVTAGVKSGRSGRGTTMFAGLLRCHCGSSMTGRFFKGRWVSYSCRRAMTDPGHTRPSTISEKKLWKAIGPVVARIRLNIEKAEVLDARIERIAKERVRLMDLFQADVEGRMTLTEYEARMGDIAGRIDRARRDQAITLAIAKPQGDDRGEWNVWLRRVYDRIELGEDLLPVRYVPRLPDVVSVSLREKLGLPAVGVA